MIQKSPQNKVTNRIRKSPTNREVEGIAVIGMACRFPGARDYEEFWRNLEEGVNSIIEIPKDRWDWRDYFGDPQIEPNKTNSKWGGFIEDIDKFDAAFFRISPKEAQCMDPQQRLILELSWSCLEDAGYIPSSLEGRNIGVFVGCCNYDYKELQERNADEIEGHASTGVYVTLIPNRVSYFFNFHGVSIPVDAACASSLMAIDQAVKSLRGCESEMALVGGVSLLCTPTYYISFSKTGMLSKDGQCKTFDKNANGYVRGEGGGVLLLKRVNEAIKDRDRIYGVIKSSAVNHGGKVRTLTSPSMVAQARVIKEAFKRGSIDPDSVSYIETHGTGTPLGDPIEVNALKRAFTSLYKKAGRTTRMGYCGLGTVKTNIGHLEPAAGIAGMIKVLLSLRHKKLPGIPNYKELNPRIHIEGSPFYIVEKTQEWEAKKDESGNDGPRRAGVSSFGFGGANAHVVVEEYIHEGSRFTVHGSRNNVGADVPVGDRVAQNGDQSLELRNKGPYLIVLSAKNEDRLKEAVKNLHAYLTVNGEPETVNLYDLAYTLQVGREAMEVRLAMIAKDQTDLLDALLGYLERMPNLKSVYSGNVKENQAKTSLLVDGEEGELFLNSIIKNRKLAKLAQLWVAGVEIEWSRLYGESKPCRISLPTYPFARKRYWLPESQRLPSNLKSKISNLKSSWLHPLVHENTSDFSEQRFSSTFTGAEFFLRDHQVKGEKILPGVAYLEMAREAVHQASGSSVENHQCIHLKNVVWARPIAVEEQPQEVHTGLFPEESGEIAYEVYADNPNQEEEPLVHGQGEATLASISGAMFMDLADLQKKFGEKSLNPTECYEVFKAMGIHYGPAHRGMQKIYIGDNEVLAKLSLPASVIATKDQFTLHSSLLDSAVQASIGLEQINHQTSTIKLPYLPFSLERLEVISCCRETMWAWLRYSDDPSTNLRTGSSPPNKMRKLDIDLWDEAGKVCGRLRGFSFQTSEGEHIHSEEFPPRLRQLMDKEDISISASYDRPPKNTLDPPSSGLDLFIHQGVYESQQDIQRSLPIERSSSSKVKTHSVVPPAQKEMSKEALQKELAASLVKILCMKPNEMDIEKQFTAIGLDSVLGVEWIREVNKKYGLSIAATQIYDYPNLLEFAQFLAKELKGKRPLPTDLREKSSPSISTKTEVLKREIRVPNLMSLKKRRFAKQTVNSSVSERKMERFSSTLCDQEPIAVVGMSGRYPGARDLDHFWKNLVSGKNCIQEVPQHRWDVNEYYDPDRKRIGKVYCKWMGLLDDIECFDPLFFMISPAEAEGMDPQHRIFLEEGYKVFEAAGYSSSSLSNRKCGVYLGLMSNEYSVLSMKTPTALSGTNNSYAIAAARIPYYLNLKGPAITIDTACSSSLVATHLAAQALQSGDVDMALVGGVTLYLTVESYIGMCSAGMLSPEGKCKTFDDGADGFVPGEGVGAILLKRLSDAERDRDDILGTIIGSGINQDGKTNGMTAPSINSQIELEQDIYCKYKIDPGSISYVEAHGTGTSLGDPIELEALSRVFKEKTGRKTYCALGSVKSNIGHTSAAAGVASIHKVLLCLRHKKLVPTLNFKKPNHHFNFEDSPFYVNTELKAWDGGGKVPRRVGVSSFGFSGTNAHVVFEEYVQKSVVKSPQSDPNKPVMIVLSAKNQERLREYTSKLLGFIQEDEGKVDLINLAYTLQIGREVMEERLGVIVHSLKELEDKLEASLEGREDVEDLYRGQVKRNKETLAVFTADEELQEAINKWLERKKHNKLLDLWVKGLIFDWNKLYGEDKPQRINAPTYPFARERYWISESPSLHPNLKYQADPAFQAGETGFADRQSNAKAISNFKSFWLHPLVHENTSDFSEQRFSSAFTGAEFFLKDHQVEGEKVLPGVAYLEMAREAVYQACGNSSQDHQSIQLKNVVWARPIVVREQPQEVHIGLFPEENGEIPYEIYTDNSHEEEGALVHYQGIATLSAFDKLPPLDLPGLRTTMNQGHLSSKKCYDAFKYMGIYYGSAYQGLESVYFGKNQVLAKLSLPSSVLGTQDQFVLHPTLMDSALQASIGLNQIINHKSKTPGAIAEAVPLSGVIKS